jgi:hypothetical protein
MNVKAKRPVQAVLILLISIFLFSPPIRNIVIVKPILKQKPNVDLNLYFWQIGIGNHRQNKSNKKYDF